MEILQLRYFYESAKSENFTKTAQKFMVPTPSVAASVKRLEKELDCTLFDRQPNKLVLNEDGKKLLHALESIFEELDNLPSLLSKRFNDGRTVKILVRALSYEFTKAITQYKLQNPNINVQISFTHPNCDYSKYDIIIDEKANEYQNFKKHDYFSTKMVLVVAKGHPLSNIDLSLKQLHNEPFILPAQDSALYRGFTSACQRMNFSPKVSVSCNDLQSYRHFLESGLGIGVARINGYGFPTSSTLDILRIPEFHNAQVISFYYNPLSMYGNVESFFHFLDKDVSYDNSCLFLS